MNDPMGESALREELPSLYEPIIAAHTDDVLVEAAHLAEEGADEGTLLWSLAQTGGTTQSGEPWPAEMGDLHAALVLRPDAPRERWPELLPVLAVSLGGAIAELCQPLTPLRYHWPAGVGLGPDPVASLRFAPRGEALILALSVRIAPPLQSGATAALSVEGGAETTAGEVLGRTARFFLDWVNRWAEEGFAPVARAWHKRGVVTAIENDGTMTFASAIEPCGDAVTGDGDHRRTLRLADALGETRA